MDWSIQQIAKIAGTTSRTLRHYDQLGLLPPSRIAANGYRHYDETALVRLQRILLLRELGLGLPQIAQILERDVSEEEALHGHLAWLRQEQGRLARQIASVQSTLDARRGGEELMAENMFDGFDHTQYKDEVEQRWGADAYTASDAWWRGQDDTAKTEGKQRIADLSRDWIAAAQSGVPADGDVAQALAKRHVEWLTSVPGAPTAPDTIKGYVLGLGEMYVADPRFAANYTTDAGGTAGAEFVRDALAAYAHANL